MGRVRRSQGAALRAALFNDTSGYHLGSRLVVSSLLDGLFAEGIQVTFRFGPGTDPRVRRDMPGAGEVDLLLVNGEGTIHSGRPHADLLTNHVPAFADQIKVPVFLVNSTVFNNPPTWRRGFKKFKKIFVRESGSQRALSEIGLESNLVPDLAFRAATALRRGQQENRTAQILVSDSISPRASVALDDWATAHDLTYVPMKSRSFSDLVLQQGGGLTRYRGVVSGRFHATVLAMAFDVPFLALESNTPKTGFFVEDALHSLGRVVPLRDLTVLKPSDVPAYSPEELAYLGSFRKTAELKASSMFKTIRELSLPG